ncbi:MAG TPA: S1/P1 nuclease [Polyangiaceae bacterium]|nr:S1/P1 nuclease [Polyangiaceae bacterium]
MTFAVAIGLALIFQAASALAWGPDGHRTVALIASGLLKGKNAEKELTAILGPISLELAAVWADCAKGVDPSDFKYKSAGKFPECAPFENPAGEAQMIDFVKRNATNCQPKPGEETCHKQYHYADISIQHADYKPSYVGARSDDIAAAIAAAIAVLQGKTPPSPFSIKDKREALLLLVHYVGDIHQPLHVGAVYLDPNGKVVNPDVGKFDPATETKGGNLITVTQSGNGISENLHAAWDSIPDKLTPAHLNAAWIKAAEGVARTPGPIAGWPSAWASDTQKQARKALEPLEFGAKSGSKWSTKLADADWESMHATQKKQLTKAGARLSQLLQALWP